MSYTWQGNIRELENVIERAVILCKGKVIEPADIPLYQEKRVSRRVYPASHYKS